MEDDRLVQLALARGYVSQEQIDRAKAEQKTLADRGVDHGVYFLLQDLGFLSDGDARDLRRSVSSSSVRALEIDGFIIQGRLGSGGMGDVFRASHPDGRMSAVKLLSAKLARSEEYVRRFLREARAMQRLAHPYIVGVHGAGESLGTRYILMELVDGPSLKSWLIEKGKLDPGHAIHLLLQISEALAHAWQHGVLHRDVKPANILMGPPRAGINEPFCSKLCDFGLARLGPDAGDADLSHGGLTGTGLALGTPHYMSPEQASGEADVDQRADIYGLGATIFHALLGQTLYSGKSSAVIMYKQVTETADLQLLRTAGISEPLVVLLGRMLEKRRDKRIATWDEVLAVVRPMIPAATRPAAPPASSAPSPRALPLPTALPGSGPAQSVPLEPFVPAQRGLMKPVLITAVVIVLAAMATVGVLLSGAGGAPTDPAGLPGALAAYAAAPEPGKVIVLNPGTYAGPWRLGASHRGLRLRASGPGVILQVASGPALICEPGMIDTHLDGLVIAGGIETIGGCDLHLTAVDVRGGMVIGGSVVTAVRVRAEGQVQVRDRGSLSLSDTTIVGRLEVDRADARLVRVAVTGPLTVRNGSLHVDGVRVVAETSPALLLDHAVLAGAELAVTAPGTGVEATSAEISAFSGLSVTGDGPSILWRGDRLAAWTWQRFALSTAPQGLPGVVPAGPGADPARLP